MTTQDALLDQYLAERDARIATQDELDRVAEELGAYKAAVGELVAAEIRASRYFGAGWLCGLVTAAVVAGLANLAYTAFFKGTP